MIRCKCAWVYLLDTRQWRQQPLHERHLHRAADARGVDARVDCAVSSISVTAVSNRWKACLNVKGCYALPRRIIRRCRHLIVICCDQQRQRVCSCTAAPVPQHLWYSTTLLVCGFSYLCSVSTGNTLHAGLRCAHIKSPCTFSLQDGFVWRRQEQITVHRDAAVRYDGGHNMAKARCGATCARRALHHVVQLVADLRKDQKCSSGPQFPPR